MATIVQKIPFLRLTGALAIGIVAASYLKIPVSISLSIFGLVLCLLLITNNYYSYRLTNIFGLGVHLLFFFLGTSVYEYYNKKPHFYDDGDFLATVLEPPIEKPNSFKSILQLNAVKENSKFSLSQEKVLAYFEKHENVTKIKPGNTIIFRNPPKPIKNKKNPYEFNYKDYLEKQNIYRQVYIPSTDWTIIKQQQAFSLKILAENTRIKLLDIYRNQNLNENELNILSALTLGYKRELDPETKRVFSSAGAMHVLAVSGLHVGIIFWILLKLLGFLRKRKAGRFIFVIAVISVLWTYAFITGLSPSVSRAATMFSFVVIGTNLNRRVNIYNSLAGSALFLLLINPNTLFAVGFQLSYAAVFGIVFLQPKLEKLLIIKYKFLNFFWQLLTVSIAAQIATFPISILYFDQFPTYFWISNLFVIPAVMILIPLGFSVLLFNAIPALASIMATSTGFIIKIVYLMLQSVENLPFSVQEVSISNLEFVFIASFIASIFLLINNFQIRYIKSSLLCLLLLLGVSLTNKLNVISQRKLIVYNSEDLMVHLISGKQNYVITDSEIKDEDYSLNLVKNTVKKLGLKKPIFLKTNENFRDESIIMEKNLVFFNEKTILINKKVIDFEDKIYLDFIINPKNINQKSKFLTSTDIVVSGKQYYSNLLDSNNKIYSVVDNGAFIKKW